MLYLCTFCVNESTISPKVLFKSHETQQAVVHVDLSHFESKDPSHNHVNISLFIISESSFTETFVIADNKHPFSAVKCTIYCWPQPSE